MSIRQWVIETSPQWAAVSAMLTILLLHVESSFAAVTAVLTGIFVLVPTALYVAMTWQERRSRRQVARELRG